jgi:hypothetical protein
MCRCDDSEVAGASPRWTRTERKARHGRCTTRMAPPGYFPSHEELGSWYYYAARCPSGDPGEYRVFRFDGNVPIRPTAAGDRDSEAAASYSRRTMFLAIAGDYLRRVEYGDREILNRSYRT